jgi:hypothetical protein
MNIKLLKNIMKEVNAPNEFVMSTTTELLSHPLYWIWKIENCRLKTLYSELTSLRKQAARFDVFINGLFIRSEDYIFEQRGNDFYIKFIRTQFPTQFLNQDIDKGIEPGDQYALFIDDEVKVKGDIERVE